MASNETALGKVAALTARLLSGWKVPTLSDARALLCAMALPAAMSTQ